LLQCVDRDRIPIRTLPAVRGSCVTTTAPSSTTSTSRTTRPRENTSG
jgi:hypothetical protein